MSISINNADDIAKMRIAGKLASEVLDYITSFVVKGVTTDKLDSLCHDYIVNVQEAIPAPLNYAPSPAKFDSAAQRKAVWASKNEKKKK